MKRFILPSITAIALFTVAGCAGLKYSEFKGEERTWPTSAAFAEATYDVPVYRGWPEKPYIVIGHVQFKDPDTVWNQGDTMQAAEMAKKQGGDAIVVLPKRADPSPTVAATRQQVGIEGNQTAAIVVKWK